MVPMLKSQSAMEYLMTYGWAILIIAVVLGATYSLGFFNSASIAPRSLPGSCQVFRPNGALSTQYISLSGSCTNELPQYVAQFNGQTGFLWTGSNTVDVPSDGNSFTITAWVKFNTPYANEQVVSVGDNAGWGYVLEYNACINIGSSSSPGITLPTPSSGVWYFYACSYNSTTRNMFGYVNNFVTNSILATYTINDAGKFLWLGAAPAGSGFKLNGTLANVQLYNTSLDSNTIKAQYLTGIGGAPVSLQNLVAWYPLNGNANDYSGNLNIEQAMSITYTNQWQNGYTVP